MALRHCQQDGALPQRNHKGSAGVVPSEAGGRRAGGICGDGNRYFLRRFRLGAHADEARKAFTNGQRFVLAHKQVVDLSAQVFVVRDGERFFHRQAISLQINAAALCCGIIFNLAAGQFQRSAGKIEAAALLGRLVSGDDGAANAAVNPAVCKEDTTAVCRSIVADSCPCALRSFPFNGQTAAAHIDAAAHSGGCVLRNGGCGAKGIVVFHHNRTLRIDTAALSRRLVAGDGAAVQAKGAADAYIHAAVAHAGDIAAVERNGAILHPQRNADDAAAEHHIAGAILFPQAVHDAAAALRCGAVTDIDFGFGCSVQQNLHITGSAACGGNLVAIEAQIKAVRGIKSGRQFDVIFQIVIPRPGA